MTAWQFQVRPGPKKRPWLLSGVVFCIYACSTSAPAGDTTSDATVDGGSLDAAVDTTAIDTTAIDTTAFDTTAIDTTVADTSTIDTTPGDAVASGSDSGDITSVDTTAAVADVCTAQGKGGCNDNNPCTVDACDANKTCTHTPLAGLPCQDDGNSCTKDLCDAAAQCWHDSVPAGTVCDDDDACTTGDVCDATGGCAGPTPKNCDDGNACNKDHCAPKTGCYVTGAAPGGGPWPDGTYTMIPPCGTGPVWVKCHNGFGEFPPNPALDDNNPCTVDTCEGGPGAWKIVHTPQAGLACVGAGSCSKGFACDGKGQCVCSP